MKKLLSLVLALTLVFGTVPILPVAAAEATLQDDLSKVENLTETLADPIKNLIHSWRSSTTKGEALTFNATYTSGNSVDVKFSVPESNASKMTDGDLSGSHGDLGGHLWFDHNNALAYVEGHTDLTFNFPVEATFNGFLLANGTSVPTDRWTWEYALYASNDLDSLYSDGNLLYHYNKGCENTPTVGQYITFPESVKAKYFGLRFLNGCNPNSETNNREWASPRIREMAIIGSCDIPDEYWITTAKQVNPCIEALDTEYNLVDSEFFRGAGQPGSFVLEGFNGTENVECKIKSYADTLELFDHDITNTTHADISGVEFYNKDLDGGTYAEGAWLGITLALRQESVIEKVFLSNASTAALQTREYEIYTSSDLETLYDPQNKCGYFLNDGPHKNQAFVFDTPRIANFVGIKILKSVQPSFNYDKSLSGARIAEIAVFGEPYMNNRVYSLKSSIEGLVEESGTATFGTELCFVAPLTKDGYSLRGWTVNGESVTDYEKNIDENKATLELTLDADLEIIARYTPDDRELTSDKDYITSGNTIRVPFGRIVQELRYGFHQYPCNISANNGDTSLTDGDYVKNGHTVNLSSNGEVVQSLKVVIAGDIDRNDTVGVSDVISLIDRILKDDATEEEKFISDLNNSGILTVSDVIKMRKTILEAPAEQINYSTPTTTTSADLDYKQQGRNMIKSDGSLYLDWTASGFSFNADLCGDVVVNLTQAYNYKGFYTAYIDGVETTVKAEGNAACDVVIAQGLKRGVHSIGFYKQTNGGAGVTINSVTINGKVLSPDSNSDLFIEFVGDSITCGAANLVKYGEEDNPPERTQDGFNSYGTQTARMLGADWSNIGVSGGTLIDNTAVNPNQACLPIEYTKNIKGGTELWDFRNNRKADIVVVNLGTNDGGIITDYAGIVHSDRVEFFSNKAVDFAHQIIEANGEDVKIIFAFGLMTTSRNFVDEAYELAVEKLKAEGFDNACYFRLPTNRDGGGGHPSIPGARIAAVALSEFIEANVK